MKIQITLSILLALALLGGCKSSTTVSDDNLGTLRGKVALSDVLCNPITIDSGATIHIEGTGFSTTTNPTGEWEIDNVPAGIYNIIITKPGFDTDLIAQDQFSGAGTQFLENGAIHSTGPLLDSVLISSVEISKVLDSLTHHDTTLYGPDTVLIEYTLNITFTMHGPDSAISFTPELRDITRRLNDPDFLQSLLSNSTIKRNANLTLSGAFRDSYPIGSEGPLPGDSILVTTIPFSCDGRSGDTVSKAFVLP